jgi:hypothetical protein
MGAGASTRLRHARADEEEADKLFGNIDRDGDKTLSVRA